MKTVSINDVQKTFSELFESAKKIGTIISHKTKRGDVVLISKATSFEQIESFIGCLLYGRIPAIIQHPSSKVFNNEFADKMAKINTVCAPSLCISDLKYNDVYSEIWDTVCEFENVVPDNTIEPDPTDIAFIQLSSGTTGLPKVLKVTHKALIEQCDEYANHINLTDDDVIVSWLPLYHDMGLIACFLLPLMKNISFVHINPFAWLSNPQCMFEQIEKHKGTHVWMPNFAFSFMAQRCSSVSNNLSSVKRWISCSEITHENDLMKFTNAFGVPKESINVCYAMAENVFAVSHSTEFKTYNGIVSCGTIIPGTSVMIWNDEIVTNNTHGEICLRSSYRTNDLTTDKFGYYHTGDMGFIHDGELYVMGRLDDMIIHYGKNIFPYDIENIISDMSDVISGRVACFGVHNDNSGTQDIFVVAESNTGDVNKLKREIISSVNKLFGVSVTCHIVHNNFIIKTSSGKISRKRTKEKVLNGS